MAEAYYGAFSQMAVLEAVYRNDPLAGSALSIQCSRHARWHGPVEQRPYLNLHGPMPCSATSGQALMAESAANLDSTQARGAEPFRNYILGTIAMTEKRPADALRDSRRMISGCQAAGAGRLPSAEPTTSPDNLPPLPGASDTWPAQMKTGFGRRTSLGPTYRRLGELYEEKGDRAKAASYYQKFIDLWRDADADLQPQGSK